LVAIDADNAAQDILIAGKADTTYVDAQNQLDVKKIGDTMTGPLLLPVANPTIAVHATHKGYVDAQNTTQDTNTAAADLLRVLKVGDTMTGPLVLPAAFPTLATHAANKGYVDSLAGTGTVVVTGPELIGDGAALTPVTFTGITIAANSALAFAGNGLSTSGLDLILVDGGVF
jgi:hypothetical protein